MAKIRVSALLGILAFEAVIAGPVAEPMITPAPLVKRVDQSLVGWVDEGLVGYTTSWGENTCKSGFTFTSASSWFKCCPTAAACNIYTGCSAGRYLVGPGTTADCSSIGLPFCSSDLLYPSLGAITAQSYFWCGSSGDTGTNIYRESPPATAGPSDHTGPTPSASPSPVPASRTPIGAIVGGVVGGLAVIGIAVGAVLLLLLRRKKSNVQPAPPPTAPQDGPGALGTYYGQQAEKSDMASPQTTQLPYTVQTPPPQYLSGVPSQAYAPQDQFYQQGYLQPMNPHQSTYGEMQQNCIPKPTSNIVELDSSSLMPPSLQQQYVQSPTAVELETTVTHPHAQYVQASSTH